jgi:type I restriction enzyme S subunit
MVPYLRAANVKDGTLDLSDVKTMNFTPDEQRLFSLQPGDVLVTEGSGA